MIDMHFERAKQETNQQKLDAYEGARIGNIKPFLQKPCNDKNIKINKSLKSSTK